MSRATAETAVRALLSMRAGLAGSGAGCSSGTAQGARAAQSAWRVAVAPSSSSNGSSGGSSRWHASAAASPSQTAAAAAARRQPGATSGGQERSLAAAAVAAPASAPIGPLELLEQLYASSVSGLAGNSNLGTQSSASSTSIDSSPNSLTTGGSRSGAHGASGLATDSCSSESSRRRGRPRGSRNGKKAASSSGAESSGINARSSGNGREDDSSSGDSSSGQDCASGGSSSDGAPDAPHVWQALGPAGGWLSRNPELGRRVQGVLRQASQLQGTLAAAAPPQSEAEPPSLEVAGPQVARAAAAAAAVPAPALPLTLGYCGENLTLRGRRQVATVSTSRTCHRRTLESRGLAHVSQLALSNCRDLVEVLRWNAAQGIRLYRVSSGLLPWALGGEYRLEQLPDFEAIAGVLAEAGEVARVSGQRLTAHPPLYVKLASKEEGLVARSIALLELQSQVFDLMGFVPSHWNKLNIHVGGTYGSKRAALHRFAAAFRRLSPGAAARLTVENDDKPNSYSVADLLPLWAETGVPITFDAHHHRFCSGGLGRREALEAALATWPSGVRPVVHWSEPPECPKRARSMPYAHSAFVFGPISLHGHEAEVDVMIESKAAERALLVYRDRLLPLHEAGLLPAGDLESQLGKELELAPHELATARAMAAAAVARAAARQQAAL